MKTIKLSTKNNVTYLLSSITTEQKDMLFSIREKHKQDILNNNLHHYHLELEHLSNLWNIDCKGILKIGETSNIPTGALSEYIETFKGKDTEGTGFVGHNREIHYRDYSKSKKNQQKLSWVVNVYEDSRACVASAVRQMDKEFCCLWEVSINSSFDNLFTEDICSLNL